MKIPKPSEEDKEYFRSLVPEEVEIKPMFGNLAGFLNGNMVMGLFGPNVGLRLSEQDRDALLNEKGAGTFGPEDRPMNEYVSIPQAWRNTPGKIEPWLDKSLGHVAAMPPKAPKKRKAKPKKSTATRRA